QNAQQELRERLQRLSPETKSRWGKMNSAQMLAHCSAGMQVPIGEMKVKRSPLRLIGWMFKGMIRNGKPFSKNSPTAPEFVIADQRSFESEKKKFQDAFDKLTKGPSAIVCFDHAFFGKMNCDDWGYLMYKHVDHHFQQFGL